MSGDPLEELREAIQESFADEGIVVRWALTAEVVRSDGRGKMLCHRHRTADGGVLDPWELIGMHRASMLVAEADLLAWTRVPDDDEDDDDG